MTNARQPAFFERIEDVVDPRHTALLLVDVQNDFMGIGGVVDRRGERSQSASALVDRIEAVLMRARAVGAVVAYVRYSRTRDHEYESGPSLRWMHRKRGYTSESVSAVEGTRGWEIVSQVGPRDGEIVVNKRRASGFHQTELDLLLRCRGVSSVVVVGASTHGCVEATARDAELRDYYVTILSDCVTAYDPALHDAALTVMRSRYDVIASGELLGLWPEGTRTKTACSAAYCRAYHCTRLGQASGSAGCRAVTSGLCRLSKRSSGSADP
jgi:nicotinamidase-related amidase